MANRRKLVKRRGTVRNICKITRTMQLIATARFQKALNRAMATKPYARKLADMVEAASRATAEVKHPLLAVNEGDRAALVIITSNRGLCGGYNGNVLRLAQSTLGEWRGDGRTVDVHAIGKKGVTYLRFLGEGLATQRTDIDDRPRFDQVSGLADALMGAYTRGDIAVASVCYMRFVSTGVQRPTLMQLLPLVREEPGGSAIPGESTGQTGEGPQYDYLPSGAELLEELLPATMRMRLFQCFTDAALSEQVARMVAMKAATDAAGDMIKLLTRQYNRARQTQITMELLDIIGGAAAIS